MRKITAIAVLTLLGGFGRSAIAAPSPVPVHLAAAFGTVPAISAVTLSGSGRALAWIQRSGSRRDVVIYNYGERRVQRVFHIDPRMRPWALRWDGSGMLLVVVTMPVHLQAVGIDSRYTIERILGLNINTGQVHVLLMSGNDMQYVSSAQLLLADSHRRHSVIMFTYEWSGNAYRSDMGTLIHNAQRDSGWEGNLFAVDPYNGDYKVIGYGNGFTIRWVVSRTGKPVARVQYHPRHHRFMLEIRRGSQWTAIYQRSDGVQPALQPVAQRDNSVLAIVPDGDGTQRLLAIPLEGGAPRDLLPGTKCGVLSLDVNRSGRPLGVTLDGGRPQYRWLDAAAEARFAAVAQAFPHSQLRVYDASRNRMEVLAEVQSAVDPPVYYLTDFATHRAMVVGQAYPQLLDVRHATTRVISYRTGKGTSVRAMVLVPPGVADRNLPLVLLAPGGPESPWSWQFDWLADYLTANGYAVLQPLLSSSGVNGPGTSAGTLNEWDGVSQRYAVAGVQVLLKQGLIDPHRVCIVGVGYGGYAALAGAASSPQTYACVVSINGVSDLPAFIRNEITSLGGVSTASAVAAFWHAQLGSPSDPKVMAESPVNRASAVRAPVLLLHSVNDSDVLFSQSQEMADALTALGKPVTLVRLPGADQSLNGSATRIAVLRAIEPFLHKYLH